MPDVVMVSIASVARLAFSGPGSPIMPVSTVGTTCQDSPYLSFSPGRGEVWPGGRSAGEDVPGLVHGRPADHRGQDPDAADPFGVCLERVAVQDDEICELARLE